ncbi:stage VI sporulation protein F [Radiobacillus kanasensis]|uniref:stage VI sporulation protein F n=1 Tax=Radiobacillus kanasensis TaxID=2844358 RepID=UPI001E6016A4|nr:stage VI sporulation protein F [Radiobacillus kanasensis]UFT97634.1 stage VI sporulation protein F [Radiobacillus kanasensis]
MSDNQKNMFDHIQQNSNIKTDQILEAAQSFNQSDLSDEKSVRNLVKQLATMAGKPVSKEKEDKLVEAITSNQIPKDLGSLSQLFKK